MNRILVFIFVFFLGQTVVAQLTIVHSDEVESLNGTTQTIVISPDFWWHELDLSVINDSGMELQVKCRRIETNVVQGTRNAINWLFSLLPLDAGEIPDWIVGTNSEHLIENFDIDETVTSFTFKYNPEGLIGASTFNVRFISVDDPDETYAEINLVFDHTLTGIAEKEIQGSIFLSPNPADQYLTVDASNMIEASDVIIYNVLGEVVLVDRIIDSLAAKDINTSELENGVYLISVAQENRIVNTSRIVIRH